MVVVSQFSAAMHCIVVSFELASGISFLGWFKIMHCCWFLIGNHAAGLGRCLVFGFELVVGSVFGC